MGKLKAELLKKGSPGLIEVDGGVGLSNAAALREAGADIVVAGSAVLGADDPAATIRALQEA